MGKQILEPRNKHAFIEIINCEICDKSFYRRTKQKRGSGNQNNVRKINAKTCSKNCSVKRCRIVRVLNNKKIREEQK